jgi:hypothetical protein
LFIVPSSAMFKMPKRWSGCGSRYNPNGSVNFSLNSRSRGFSEHSSCAKCPRPPDRVYVNAGLGGWSTRAGCLQPKTPNRLPAGDSNSGEGAGAGFHVLRGAPRTQHHSGARQHIRRPDLSAWLRTTRMIGPLFHRASPSKLVM